jgi:hypothetical protein
MAEDARDKGQPVGALALKALAAIVVIVAVVLGLTSPPVVSDLRASPAAVSDLRASPPAVSDLQRSPDAPDDSETTAARLPPPTLAPRVVRLSASLPESPSAVHHWPKRSVLMPSRTELVLGCKPDECESCGYIRLLSPTEVAHTSDQPARAMRVLATCSR